MLEPIAPEHKPPALHVPYVAFTTTCGDLGSTYSCNRPRGHSGRHCYSWRNITAGSLRGQVRAVWSR
jgi:hypothetical protein